MNIAQFLNNISLTFHQFEHHSYHTLKNLQKTSVPNKRFTAFSYEK